MTDLTTGSVSEWENGDVTITYKNKDGWVINIYIDNKHGQICIRDESLTTIIKSEQDGDLMVPGAKIYAII